MLSIIIPCYNDHMVLPRAVNSALAQKGPKEIIVVDDGSNPPIKNVWGNPVRVLRHPINMGLSTALNTGIANSTYTRFVILASDDELHPNYAEEMLKYDTDIVSCNFQANGHKVRCIAGHIDRYKRGNCHSYAALVKKDMWRRVGGFNRYMNPSWEDYEFFLHCAKEGAQWTHVDKELHIYHRNPVGRDEQSQGMDIYLKSLMSGFHPEVFGKGAGMVTFVIPCYNHAQYLETSLRSVFEQTYPHVSAVVVDDNSPDDVEGAMRALDFLPKGKVIGVKHTENLHLSAARNTGIRIAFATFNPQWLVMLDADDAVAPSFVTSTMSAMRKKSEYVYTSVQFIGDAWHRHELAPIDCIKFCHTHQHPCTFLMPSKMYRDIIQYRGHGYDERMKSGFEDWDFALGAIGAGYCGVHLPKYLFHYRYHENGSMRTDAIKISKELGRFVRSKPSNAWTRNKESARMACKTCGKSYVRLNIGGGAVNESMYNVPTIGAVTGDTIIVATYTGTRVDTQTKLGQAGKIYHYSANPTGTYGPVFDMFARDIHLFLKGFSFAMPVPEVEQPVAQAIATPPPESSIMAQPAVVDAEEVQPMVHAASIMSLEVKEEPIVEDKATDDLTLLKGIGPKTAEKLNNAGLFTFEDVEMTPAETLAEILGWKQDKVETLVMSAIELAL